MDTNLLRSWLGLPPGAWPPPDRELLGLAPGPIVAAEAERRVLERMARLRPHQLVHPELVTEGMNRVAQALLAVTAYACSEESAAPSGGDDAMAVDLQAVVIEAPMVMEAEVVEAEIVVAGPLPEPRVRTDRRSLPPPAPQPVAPKPPAESVELPAISLPVPTLSTSTDERRQAYRQLAGLRAVRRALEQLRPYLGTPQATAATAGQVFGLVEATIALRAALRHPGLSATGLGIVIPSVVSVIGEPLVLAIFRSLGSQQRLALAKEWATGRSWVEAASVSLRTALRQSRIRSRKSGMGSCFQAVSSHPEWLLGILTILVLALSGIRAFLW